MQCMRCLDCKRERSDLVATRVGKRLRTRTRRGRHGVGGVRSWGLVGGLRADVSDGST